MLGVEYPFERYLLAVIRHRVSGRLPDRTFFLVVQWILLSVGLRYVTALWMG